MKYTINLTISGEVSRAIGKLHKPTKKSCIRKLSIGLQSRVLWQVHVPRYSEAGRYIEPHFTVQIPNQQHQFDVLYMPHDLCQGSTYKYLLTGIDVASRYKVPKPLRTKKASDVAFLLKNIYESKANPLKWPEVLPV